MIFFPIGSHVDNPLEHRAGKLIGNAVAPLRHFVCKLHLWQRLFRRTPNRQPQRSHYGNNAAEQRMLRTRGCAVKIHVRCLNATPQPQYRCTPEVVTKLGSLHSASIWPPFRLCARSVALKFAPAPAPDFQPTDRTVSRKTGLPQDTPRDQTAHRSTPPSLPLHSGSQVSSRRRIEWCDQSGVEFSAKRAANSTPFSSQMGWRTTDTFIDAMTSPA